MVAKCCIRGCTSEQYPGCEMTFHGFPSDDQLKTKWIEAARITGNVKFKKICQLHFKSEDFILKSRAIRLKQNVIPTYCTPPFNTYTIDNNKLLNPSNISYENIIENGGIEKCFNIIDSKLQESNDTMSINKLSGSEQDNKFPDIDRCKCCLKTNGLKSMWREHCSGVLREVYGIMLSECFALHWSRPENPKTSRDLICKSCVARLRDAVSFKKEVLASEQLLRSQLEAGIEKLKEEQDELEVDLQTESVLCDDNVDIEEDCDRDDDFTDVDKFHDDGESNMENDSEFAIKLESRPIQNDTLTSPSKYEASRASKITSTLKKRKESGKTVDALERRVESAKKLKTSRKTIPNMLKNTRENNVMFENLKESVEAVEIKKRSQTNPYSEPLQLFPKEINKVPDDVPDELKDRNETKNGVVIADVLKIIDDDNEDSQKTIAEIKGELNSKKGGKMNEKDIGRNIKKLGENRLAEMKKQANNIAVILESTNATPIRRHGGIGYGCCFCSAEFPDAADLKQHTIKEHDMKTKRNYAKGKRPSAYLVKLDITGLKCNLCGNTIDSLEHLYDHLIEVHKKLLYKNAKNYVVPFKFDQEELRCLCCEFICNSFKGLLEHMSMHYRNHICEICNAGFLTKNNLFNHAGRHKKGTFKCDYCPKVYDTSSKKAGHQRLVHSNTNGVNRCGYCGEMFGTYRRKEKHLMTEHGVILKKLKCKACDKIFETQTALRIHTKRDHLIERRFKCSICDKRCFTNVQLNQHILKHTGVKKFQCSICFKAYGRKSTLREHMRIHENDRRFKCELCGLAFIQKCSWRGHMMSKHGQQV